MTEPGEQDPPAADDPTTLVLAEPIRLRLVQLAAEVLGRLPADEVPASLRVVARFTPTKRARAGAAILSAALDGEPDFRSKVADVVAETTPQLVAAVQDGTSTAASDPLDMAVVAYLMRPPGWAELIAAATERWAEQRQDTATEHLDRLRSELAEARAQLRAEPARLRDAVAAALAEQGNELETARRSLRVRTGELRAAERERDAARAAAEAAEQARLADAGAADAELTRLRTRVAELERAAEAARRNIRREREIADARVRLLLDSLVDAAAGLRRELDLPAATVRPADAVLAQDGPAGGRAVSDPVAFDRVLDLPQAHLIVDGYNVTKSGYGDLPLADQRVRLMTALAALHARVGLEITVAFDGSARPPSAPRVPRGLRVLFSAEGEIADDLIRRLVAAEPPGRAVLVVTSDRAIVNDVRRAGAWTIPSAVLLARLG